MNKLQTLPQHIGKIMGDDTKMAEKEVHFRQALIDYPENEAGILHLIMMCLACQEKNQECIDVCERILTLLDENDEKSEIYFYEGKRYHDLKDDDKAIECFMKAIECDRSHFGVAEDVEELADIYKERLDWENVIKAFDFITDDEKYDIHDKSNKHFEQGRAYGMLKDYFKAIECYDKYLDLFPDDTGIIMNKGSMYGELGLWDEAIVLFRKCLEIDPNSAEAYYSIGVAYNGKDDHLMAMHYYLEALKIKPDYLAALNNMGAITNNDLGDAQKGIELLEKALELAKEDDPYKGFLILNLCKINKHLTNFERAEYYQSKFMGLFGFEMIEDDDEEE
ncbi:MAG: tetratricopeptide repeat protein [Bacteroidota bacterium]